MSDQQHSADLDAHATPAPSAFKKIANIAVLLGLPLLVVVSLVSYYKAQSGGQVGSDAKGLSLLLRCDVRSHEFIHGHRAADHEPR